jgi:hypothetical protein
MAKRRGCGGCGQNRCTRSDKCLKARITYSGDVAIVELPPKCKPCGVYVPCPCRPTEGFKGRR